VAQQTVVVFSPDGANPPEVCSAWLRSRDLHAVTVVAVDDLMARALRGRPRLVLFDGRTDRRASEAACARLKSDSFTGIIPSLFYCIAGAEAVAAAFASGADEVLSAALSDDEQEVRMDVLLRRSDRDVYVHPSTRLPGTIDIEAEITRRLGQSAPFGVCYADLDHFKEFNDRYSYYDGDRVIRVLAKILHDVVKGVCGEDGFVGHIGGDDFIFVVPAVAVNETCAEIVSIFDALVPYQYSEQDRRAGYFFGKDRRGQLHRVPLMTVSIGVVSNERRQFTSASQVSELATEMKSYAKTLTGSVYTIDRRQDPPVEHVVNSPTARSDVPFILGGES
jgi:diguanylate cyclase (GGDEF)-like protein